MRTRREFTPVVDFMPSRIAPSAVAGLAHVAVLSHGVATHQAPPPSGMSPMDTSGSYPIIAGEPTPPPGTNNC